MELDFVLHPFPEIWKQEHKNEIEQNKIEILSIVPLWDDAYQINYIKK